MMARLGPSAVPMQMGPAQGCRLEAGSEILAGVARGDSAQFARQRSRFRFQAVTWIAGPHG